MIASLLQFIRNIFKSKIQLQVENIYLRKQLEILSRTNNRVSIKKSDRILFVLAKRFLQTWKEELVVVQPETLIKWHRERFKIFWRKKSKRGGGRKKIDNELINVINQIAQANITWGVPRIHGEIVKLGYNVSQATVYRYLKRRGRKRPSQNWQTFLKNHSKEIISMDFFSVPTLNFKIVYVLVVIEHHRRKVIHFNVTKHPTSFWTAQQVRNSMYDDNQYKYVVRDRDSKYGNYYKSIISEMGMKEVVTSYKSPWQNCYVERLIGSIRREALDHFIIINEEHLKDILKEYFSYYNRYRTHLGIAKDSPEGRPIEPEGRLSKTPVLNGLHNIYFREAA